MDRLLSNFLDMFHIYLGILALAPGKQYFLIFKGTNECLFISNITEKNGYTYFDA